MGEIMPAKSQTPTPAGGSSSYDRLQRRLADLAHDLDQATVLLNVLRSRIQHNASRAHDTATKAAQSDFDTKPVEAASAVSVALGGIAVDVRRLAAKTKKMAGQAADAQVTHQRLYEPLHKVRAGRKERTPKPGAFIKHP